MPRLHLASSSLRRKELLQALGVRFTAAGVDVDESPIEGEEGADMVLRLAKAKAAAAEVDLKTIVLGSDTTVVLDGRIFGKPASQGEALAMLEALSGCTHQVMTGVAVRTGARVSAVMSTTDVEFREISRDEALQYWQSGEPEGKAGAYAIQGLGGVFVKGIAGSYSGVVGLPVYETAMLLRDAGFDFLPAASDGQKPI